MQTVKLYYAGLFVCCILFMLMLTGCAEFQTKMDMMKSEQLTCSAEDMTLCAGWKI